MVKTTVYLPEETKQRLRTAARLEGISEADVIRQAIDARVASVGRGFKLRRPILSSSVLNSNDTEAVLAQGFGE